MDYALLQRPHIVGGNDSDGIKPPKKVTWIEAPPGYGKTTLIHNLMNLEPGNPFYYSFVSNESGPNWFLQRLVNWCRQTLKISIDPELLSSKAADLDNVHGLAQALQNNLTSPVTLYLDDYQNVSDSGPVNDVLILLLQVASPLINLVVASRVRPHPVFERLRFNGELHIVDSNALLFTKADIDALLKLNKIDQELLSDQIFTLSKGWGAAIQLLVGSAFVENNQGEIAKGLHLSIVNYYRSEIRPLMEVDFFDHLCGFSYFTPELAAILCGRDCDVVEDLLRKLSQSGFFVYCHEFSPNHYYLHPVIKDAFASSTDLCRPDQLSEIELLELADQISEQAESFLNEGLDQSLLEWIDFFPKSLYEQHIWLRYWHARILTPKKPGSARDQLLKLYHELEQVEDTSSQLIVWAALVDTFIIQLSEFSSARPWISELNKLEARVENYPSLECEANVLAALNGLFQWIPPYNYDLSSLFKRTEHCLYELECPTTRLRLATAYLRHLVNQGSYYKARAVMGVLPESGSDMHLHVSDWVQLYYSRWLGNYMCGMQSHDEYHKVSVAQRKAKSQGLTVIDLSVRYMPILAYLAQDRVEEARVKITEAQQTLDLDYPLDKSHLDFVSGWLALCDNDYEAARVHQLSCYWISVDAGEVCNMYTLAHLIIIETDSDQDQEAQKYIELLYELAYKKNGGLARLHYHYTKGYFHLCRGDTQNAVQEATEFFRLCRKNSIYDFAGRVSRVLAPLFEIAIEHEIEPLFAQKMIVYQRAKPLFYGNMSSAWPHPIMISTFGQVEIEVNRQKLTGAKNPSKTEIKLLKLLISNEGKPLDINTIEQIIWPDQDSLKPGGNFKSTTARVRKRLGSRDVIIVKENRAVLNKKLVWVDAWNFADCVRQLNKRKKTLTDTECDRYVKALTKLYRGDFSLDINQESWLFKYQNRLQAMYVDFMAYAAQKYHSDHAEAPTGKSRRMLELVIAELVTTYKVRVQNLKTQAKHAEADSAEKEIDLLLAQLGISTRLIT